MSDRDKVERAATALKDGFTTQATIRNLEAAGYELAKIVTDHMTPVRIYQCCGHCPADAKLGKHAGHIGDDIHEVRCPESGCRKGRRLTGKPFIACNGRERLVPIGLEARPRWRVYQGSVLTSAIGELSNIIDSVVRHAQR